MNPDLILVDDCVGPGALHRDTKKDLLVSSEKIPVSVYEFAKKDELTNSNGGIYDMTDDVSDEHEDLDATLVLPSPREFFQHAQEKSDIYGMTDDVTDEQFEEVLAEAKGEGNMSRSNVVRKIKNLPTFSEAQGAGSRRDRHHCFRSGSA